MKKAIVIPVYNEEKSIPLVIRDIPKDPDLDIVVVNNGSTDRTGLVLSGLPVTALKEPRRGYGAACWCGIEYLAQKDTPPDILIFLDGDYSDHPEELKGLVKPIEEDGYDLVIGSRALGESEPGSFLPQARFGNALACFLIKRITGYEFTDLGPFRAIRFDRLLKMGMVDRDFGWTVEMQIKAAKKGWKTCEVPVSYRKRTGVSKISGTLSGTFRAGYKILYTIFRYASSPAGRA